MQGNTIYEHEQSDEECNRLYNGQAEGGREYSRCFIKRGLQDPEAKKVDHDDDAEFEVFDDLFISE
jgi:hypothetical protein